MLITLLKSHWFIHIFVYVASKVGLTVSSELEPRKKGRLNRAKHCWVMSMNFLFSTPSNVLPFHLKQTFPPIILIFTDGEGDGIESRLPLKNFSTLNERVSEIIKLLSKFHWSKIMYLFQIFFLLLNQSLICNDLKNGVTSLSIYFKQFIVNILTIYKDNL